MSETTTSDTARRTQHELLCQELYERFGLTPKEVEVLGFATCGKSNEQISRLMWVVMSTVKFHLTNTYRKMGVTNRVAAGKIYEEVQRQLGQRPAA